jgi:hypothetical protein
LNSALSIEGAMKQVRQVPSALTSAVAPSLQEARVSAWLDSQRQHTVPRERNTSAGRRLQSMPVLLLGHSVRDEIA